MITKDGRDTAIENLTSENYVVPKGEEMAYHCVIEVPQHDTRTGKKISKPRVQKFGKKAYETTVRDSLLKQGFVITVLYDPNPYIAQRANMAKESAAAKQKAEQERIDAAVAAALAEQQKRVDETVAAAVAAALAAQQEKANAEPAPAAEPEPEPAPEQAQTAESEQERETKKPGRPKGSK